MIHFLKRYRGIAFFLVILMLFQSCIVIYRNPSSIEQATARKNTRIKIHTKGGWVHKLRWIEERDGKVYSISNTKRVYIDMDKIGTVPMKHKLINIQDKGDYISGLKIIGKDTTTIIIPIDEIEKIKIVNREISYPLNIVWWGLFTVVAGYGLFVALWYLSDSSI